MLYKIVILYYKFTAYETFHGKHRHIPKALWKNDYPIVLVHGFAGGSHDQSLIQGTYFVHAVRKYVQPYDDVYLAVVSPFSCIHDRACELYQQLVGFETLRK